MTNIPSLSADSPISVLFYPLHSMYLPLLPLMPVQARSHQLLSIALSMHHQLFYHVLPHRHSSTNRMRLRIVSPPIQFLFLRLLNAFSPSRLLVPMLSIMLRSPRYVFQFARLCLPSADPLSRLALLLMLLPFPRLAQ